MSAVASRGKPLELEVPDPVGGRPHRLELELDRGYAYRVAARDPELRAGLIERFVDTLLAAVVPADGGLIGNLKVWENLVLPVAYHGRPDLAETEEKALRIFRGIGMSERACARICASAPGSLTRFELRAAAFVRAMLTEPEIMVYEAPLEGLDRDEAEAAAGFDRSFHLHFPFRTSVFVTPDAQGPPEVAPSRAFVF